MDELVRLRQFQPAAAPSAATRAQARAALDAAIKGGSRHTFRPLLLAAAILAAAALATGAYALYRAVIVGSPAPAKVQRMERLLGEVKGELIPQAHQRPGLEVAKTRAAAVITTSVGPAYLWVAPNTRGDSCAYLEIVAADLPDGRPNLSGGCSQAGTGFYVGVSYIRVNDHLLGLLQGRIGTKQATEVEVIFANGRSQMLPISDHYVLAETDPTNAIAKTIVRDAHGHALAQRVQPKPISPLHHAQHLRQALRPVGSMHTVATLRTIGKHRLLIEKSGAGPHGTICSELVTPSGTGRGCNQRVAPTALDIGPTQIGSAPHGWLLLDGPVGPSIRSLELRFEDGSHVPVPIHHGYVLYQFNPKNFRSGHRPTELIAKDAHGNVVRVRRFGFLP